MPKVFGKEVSTVTLGVGVLAVLVLGYKLTSSDDTPTTPKKKIKPPIKKSYGQTDYLDADYAFKIAPLPDSTTPKDVFKPLVSKDSLTSAAGNQSIDSYTYSGMAQLNGVANGLLENSQTGQGDFVQPGQRWHEQWQVIKVTGDEIALRNDSGDVKTLLAGAAMAKEGNAVTAPAAAAGAPVANPVMVGPIGASDITIQADVSAAQAQPQINMGRRGRGRGRGRGGAAADGN